MVNHLYGHNKKAKRNEINTLRKESGMKGDFEVGLLDSWQNKSDYYRHTPGLNVDGNLITKCGTKVPNQPNDAETQIRRAKIGMFPIEWDGRCRLEAKGGECMCNPKAEKVKEEVKVEKKSSI
jgi:hypothetical protein